MSFFDDIPGERRRDRGPLLPHAALGLLQRATFNNIEHQSIEFATDTIRPWCVRFEQAIHRSLFSPRE